MSNFSCNICACAFTPGRFDVRVEAFGVLFYSRSAGRIDLSRQNPCGWTTCCRVRSTAQNLRHLSPGCFSFWLIHLRWGLPREWEQSLLFRARSFQLALSLSRISTEPSPLMLARRFAPGHFIESSAPQVVMLPSFSHDTSIRNKRWRAGGKWAVRFLATRPLKILIKRPSDRECRPAKCQLLCDSLCVKGWSFSII